MGQSLKHIQPVSTGELDGNPEIRGLPVLPPGDGRGVDAGLLRRLGGVHSPHGAEHIGIPGGYDVPRHNLPQVVAVFIANIVS